MTKVKGKAGKSVEIPTIQILRLILREWKMALSSEEWEVILFVFDRTLGWQKLEEAIPHHHFLEGLKSYDKTWATPLYQAKSTLSRSLGSLRRKGVLRVSQPGGAQRWRVYSINLQWDYHRWTRSLALEDFGLSTRSEPLQDRWGDSYEAGFQPLRHRDPNLVSSMKRKPPKGGSLAQAGNFASGDQRKRKKGNGIGPDSGAKAAATDKVPRPRLKRPLSADRNAGLHRVRLLPSPKLVKAMVTPEDLAFPPWDDDDDGSAYLLAE